MSKSANQHGFSLIEAMIASAVLFAVTATVSVGLRAGHRSNFEIERHRSITAMAEDFMERLFQIQYGNPTDPAASASQLTQLFDPTLPPGGATLSSLLPVPTMEFAVAGFPYPGNWTVQVSQDLNRDGDELDQFENEADLIRINLSFQGLLVLESIRTRPLEE